MDKQINQIIDFIKSNQNPSNIAGMARFGINSENVYGVPLSNLKSLAKELKKNHDLAWELWDTNIYEARVIALLIDDHKLLTENQMEKWVKDFDSWAICDGTCLHLFRKNTVLARKKILEWVDRDEEYVKRGGFVLMATLAVHDKKADNKSFEEYFNLIIRECFDSRNFVKKAVNWALRQIGKRNKDLNFIALNTCEHILENFKNDKTARWIANNAKRELLDPKILSRLK